MSRTITAEELEVIKKTDPLAGLIWESWIASGKATIEGAPVPGKA